MAIILEGKPVAAAINEKLARDIIALRDRGVLPTLAILRMGSRPDDISYERGAMKRCESLGVAVKNIVLPGDAPQSGLENAIRAVNADSSVHGLLLFRPLPEHINDREIRGLIDVKKDVDGITDASLSGVFTGCGKGFAPCTAQACMELLEFYGTELAGKNVVIVGRSLVVGRPLAMLMLQKNATVTICHTKTKNLKSVCKNADIVAAAAGRAEMLNGDYFSSGQTVLDVGINVNAEGKLCGDVLFAQAESSAGAITPVPGGIGTVTTAVLLKHVVESAQSMMR